MSFLAGRLAGTEGAYFLQESKHAVGRLIEKNKPKQSPPNPPSSSTISLQTSSTNSTGNEAAGAHQADVLPEILRHSLPSKIFQPLSESSISKSPKWVLPSDPNNRLFVSPDVMNPLRAYVSLPQVTFGPRRWNLPRTENSVTASIANDLRRDKHNPSDSEKLTDVAIGLTQIGKGFAVATVAVFGGSTLLVGFAASKLEIHNSDDIKTRGKELLEPKLEIIKEQILPFKYWAEDVSKKYRLKREENIRESNLIKELKRILGPK